jgi:hypothetical protein
MDPAKAEEAKKLCELRESILRSLDDLRKIKLPPPPKPPHQQNQAYCLGFLGHNVNIHYEYAPSIIHALIAEMDHKLHEVEDKIKAL